MTVSLAKLLWNEPDDATEVVVESFVSAACAAWPQLRVSAEALLLHVKVASKPASAHELAALHGADLLLTCACLANDRLALDLLEQRYLVRTEGSIARIDASTAFIDEVRQAVRQRLLVGARPRLHDFQGRGSLGGWLKTVTVRQALTLKREAPKPQGEVNLEALGGVTSDLDARYLKAHYQEAFSRAFRSAVRSLSDRDRSLLKLHYVESQSVDRIGALYGVHRATAARWVASARQSIHDHLVTTLKTELAIPADEIESFVNALRTQVEVSLRSNL
jgi:RNA polymerase sigma-70 factor (ECF subfamily)